MDIQQQLAIAVKMLEHGLSMNDIRFCSPEELVSIAKQRLYITPSDLETFAEEVAKRSQQLTARQQREKASRAGITVLFTDDESSRTSAMQMQGFESRPLAEKLSYLQAGYHIEFRLRDKELAERCSRVIGQKIEATQEPLPPLKEHDIIMFVPEWQLAKGTDFELMVERFIYRT